MVEPFSKSASPTGNRQLVRRIYKTVFAIEWVGAAAREIPFEKLPGDADLLTGIAPA
jgi:hypothetical protein